MNSDDAARLDDRIDCINERPYDLICRIRAVIEVEFHVIDPPLDKSILIVEFCVQPDDQFNVPLFKIVQAVEERIRQPPL